MSVPEIVHTGITLCYNRTTEELITKDYDIVLYLQHGHAYLGGKNWVDMRNNVAQNTVHIFFFMGVVGGFVWKIVLIH